MKGQRVTGGCAALIALAWFGGTSCTTLTTDRAECEQSSECRATFGFGSVCRSDGFCERQDLSDRCTQTYPTNLLDIARTVADDADDDNDVIVFGSLMERSQPLFAALENSARLAIKQADEEGGVARHRFGMVFCDISEGGSDGLSREDAAVASANYLSDDLSVPAIFGPAFSGDTQLVFQSIAGSGTLVISPSATSPALTQLDPLQVSDENPGLLWRTAPPDSLQGKAIAVDMRAPGEGRTAVVTRVAAIHQKGPYGEGLAQVFAEEFQRLGGTVTLFPFETTGQRDSFVTMAGLGNFEEVLFVSSEIADVVAFLDEAATLSGYDNKGLFLTDAAATDDVLGSANSARFGQVRATRPAPLNRNTDLVYATFLSSFFAEYNESAEDQIFTANSYDAGWLLAYGASWAVFNEGEVSGRNIARGLRKISNGDALDVGSTTWASVQQRFSAEMGINITGSSGELDYDPETEETSADVEIWTISGRNIQPVYSYP